MSDPKEAKPAKDPKGVTITVMGREFRVAAKGCVCVCVCVC